MPAAGKKYLPFLHNLNLYSRKCKELGDFHENGNGLEIFAENGGKISFNPTHTPLPQITAAMVFENQGYIFFFPNQLDPKSGAYEEFSYKIILGL
jgi:hypothetical protein